MESEGTPIEERLMQARDQIRRLSPQEAAAAQAEGAVIIDTRDSSFRSAEGVIPGSVWVTRDTLEWRADPNSDQPNPVLADFSASLIVVCNEGYGSSLAADSLRQLGHLGSSDVVGGFRAWKAAGLPTAAAGETDRAGLSALSANASSADIRAYYDGWAVQYNDDLASWNYDAPTVSANLLVAEVPADAPVLDVGCGTGLSGMALQNAGFSEITGVDLSPTSLEIARETGAYSRLDQVDLHELPLAFEAASFGGLQCVGVLSYVPDTEKILREFCRLVANGGVVVFSQRQDIYQERDYEAVLAALEAEGVCTPVSVSDPQPYLPGNDEFGDEIEVIYVVLRVA